MRSPHNRSDRPAPAARWYPWYVVVILMLAFVSSFLDRQILGLLVGPIRRDLGITDTGMSLLMGLSFALFYTVLGLPLGWLADRTNRRNLIALAIAAWSAMTAACGFARSYVQFFLARIGVGVGEAGLSPPAYSLLADYFPADRLGLAVSVYSMGIYVGAGLANVLGGLLIGLVDVGGTWMIPVLGAFRPWQVVFLVLALPGLLLSLAMLTVREPIRRGDEWAASYRPVPIRAVTAYLRANRGALAFHHGGLALVALANYGVAAWAPTLFVRTYGWDVAHAGIALGTVTAIVGPIGVVLGGAIADRLLRAGRSDAKLRVCGYAAVGLCLSDLLFPLMSSAAGALVVFVPLSLFAAMPFGVGPAAVQELVPAEMRAQGSAVYLFIVSAVGVGLGPTAVALGTDYIFGADTALRYALALTAGGSALGGVVLLHAGRVPYRTTLTYRARWSRDVGSMEA